MCLPISRQVSIFERQMYRSMESTLTFRGDMLTEQRDAAGKPGDLDCEDRKPAAVADITEKRVEHHRQEFGRCAGRTAGCLRREEPQPCRRTRKAFEAGRSERLLLFRPREDAVRGFRLSEGHAVSRPADCRPERQYRLFLQEGQDVCGKRQPPVPSWTLGSGARSQAVPKRLPGRSTMLRRPVSLA